MLMGPSIAGKVLLPILEPDLLGLQETIEFVLGLESQDPSKLTRGHFILPVSCNG